MNPTRPLQRRVNGQGYARRASVQIRCRGAKTVQKTHPKTVQNTLEKNDLHRLYSCERSVTYHSRARFREQIPKIGSDLGANLDFGTKNTLKTP